MIDRAIDALTDFTVRFRVPISLIAGAWFVLSWASSAQFIELPSIPGLTGTPGILASSAVNGLWWGWLNPRVEQRRADRAEAPESETANG